MRIPPYWTRETCERTGVDGQTQSTVAWGWSFTSQADAAKDAADRARRVMDRLTSGQTPDEYDYMEHPPREQIVQTIRHDGAETAIITRNKYGALILNTASVCFVDVDLPQRPVANGLVDAILLRFSAGRRQQRRLEEQVKLMSRIGRWTAQNPGRSFRLYRTAAGLRLLFTDALYSPTSAQTARLLDELGSDPLYRRLTERQESFRARLTPKPWRCGSTPPPSPYPRTEPAARRAFAQWQRDYEARCRGYAVCHLVQTVGDAPADGPIGVVIRLHDQYTCARDGERLA